MEFTIIVTDRDDGNSVEAEIGTTGVKLINETFPEAELSLIDGKSEFREQKIIVPHKDASVIAEFNYSNSMGISAHSVRSIINDVAKKRDNGRYYINLEVDREKLIESLKKNTATDNN